MTDNFEPKHFLTHLPLPTNDLARLTFCSGSKTSKVKDWVESLRATQISQTSAALYRSLPELARLKADYKTRFEMLEVIRPSVHHCLQGLSRDFLNQPVVLPEPAHKAAVVAQALQKYMVDGYVVCARDIVVQNRQKAQTLDILTTALHRAITGIGQIVLRSYQLYTHPPASLWRLAHNLHRTACFYELQKKPIADKILADMPASTIDNAYARILLLASAGTNQLGQQDMALVYKALAKWCPMVRLLPSISDKGNFFVVNQSREQPPENKARFAGSDEDHVLELDLGALLDQLNRQGGRTDDIVAAKNAGDSAKLSGSLVAHLLRRWGSETDRKMDRRPVQHSADVCIGLVDCHYFVSGAINFEEFIDQSSEASAWQNDIGRTFSAGLTPADSKAAISKGFAKPTYPVTVQNISAGGYCLLWQGEMPARVEAGELIGVKEAGRKTWNVGVVRWIKQLKQASQLGIQLLSNHAMACGIAQVYDMGGFSDYMRAIMLPPSKFGEVPATLLTATAPFQDMTKAKLLNDQKISPIKLDRCLFSTGIIKQFSYHSLEAAEQGESKGGRNRSFSSSWEDN